MRARTLAGMTVATAALALLPSGALAAKAYVVNCGCDDTVSVIDSATRTVSAPIPVGPGPFDVAVAPGGARAYVSNNGGDTVSVVIAALGSAPNLIQVGDNPSGIALSPDGATLYVANMELGPGSPTLSIVDTATRATTATVPLTGIAVPGDAAISPDGHTLYVLDYAGTDLAIVDLTGTPSVTTVPLSASGPQSLTVSRATREVYVTDIAGDVLVLDAAGNELDTIPVGTAPFDVALDPSGATAWVTDQVANEASRLDTATGVPTATTGIGEPTEGVAVSPDGDGVFVVAPTSDRVAVLDPATGARVAWIPVADQPSVIAFQPPTAPAPPTPPAPARPLVTDVSPRSGPETGGQRVTIRGANFGSARQVLFGDTPATAIEVVDFNALVATTPPGLAGQVRVAVIGPGGESTEAGTYMYQSVAPSSGPTPPPSGPSGPPAPVIARPDCVVPDVRGLTLAGARTRLTAANCIVGTTSQVRGQRDQRVVRQAIAPGTHKPYRWGVALALRPRGRR